jgi:hypothetical protein
MICTTRGRSLSLSEMTVNLGSIKAAYKSYIRKQDKEYLLEANRTLGKKYIKLAHIMVAGAGIGCPVEIVRPISAAGRLGRGPGTKPPAVRCRTLLLAR